MQFAQGFTKIERRHIAHSEEFVSSLYPKGGGLTNIQRRASLLVPRYVNLSVK